MHNPEPCSKQFCLVSRYLLNLPGMAYSARLKYLMFCNSSVIFANNQQEEFWYNLLEVGHDHHYSNWDCSMVLSEVALC